MNNDKKNQPPKNNEIPYDKMIVIDSEGKSLGLLTKQQAINAAEQEELDLVLLAPSSDTKPAVTKITDYGKFLYQKKIKEKENKQKVQKMKEITVKPLISDGDLAWKAKETQRWLKEGSQVKFQIRSTGKLATREELINEVYQRFFNLIKDDAKIISPFKKNSPILHSTIFGKNK
ncbi:MAG: translation initiation factor IF-3 [Mycoplasmataceae bacterium]|nr:translation initiation factor IF-3 [Mycoplasmataceae bacterium]